MYKLLIFDWDGTLIDSAARIVSSMQRAAAENNLPRLEDHLIRDIIGLGLPEALQMLYPGIDSRGIEGMRAGYSHYYLKADETPTALFPGVEAGLERLREAGHLLAVATGKSRRGLNQVFEETGMASLFHLSRCADETRSKPDPLMLEEILAETGQSREAAVMIGDTEFDLEMASRASMASVGVSYGVHDAERLLRHRPRAIVHGFEELEAWLGSQTERNQTERLTEESP